MKRTKRYYDIYDVSIFDLLRSGGQFPSGRDVSEDQLAEEYKRGYREAEDKQLQNMTDMYNKLKEVNDIDDQYETEKVNKQAEKEADDLQRKMLESIKYKAYTEGYFVSEKEGDKITHQVGDHLLELYNEKEENELEYELDKLDLELDKKLAELRGYTLASIPTIRMKDQNKHQPLLQSTIEEEIDELLEKEDFVNEDFNYLEKPKELRSQIKKERDDTKELEEIVNKQTDKKMNMKSL